MIPLFSRQIPPFGTNTRIGDYDYSNEMKALGVNLDMLKERAEDVIKAYRHSLSTKSDGSSPFDPTVLLISAVVCGVNSFPCPDCPQAGGAVGGVQRRHQPGGEEAQHPRQDGQEVKH